MKIAFLSNYRNVTGYSTIARGYISAIKTTGVELATRNIDLKEGNYFEEDVCEKKSIEDVDFAIYNTLPDFYKRASSCKTVGIFCWETSKLPERWVSSINKETDAIFVLNEGEKFICEKNGVTVPIFVVPPHINIKKEDVKRGTINSDITDSKTYVFYNIMDFNARKNLGDLLYCFFAEFRSSDNCILFLHIPCSNNEEKRKNICDLIEYTKKSLKINDYSKVFFSNAGCSEDDIMQFHFSGDTFISLSHGESWNIPMFTAHCLGNRIISTICAGPSEYLEGSGEDVSIIECDFVPVKEMFLYDDDMYNGKGLWLSPKISKTMKEMRRHYDLGRIEQKIYNESILNKYSKENVGKTIVSCLEKIS